MNKTKSTGNTTDISKSSKAELVKKYNELQLRDNANAAILSISEGMSLGRSLKKIFSESLDKFASTCGFGKACLFELSADETQLLPLVSLNDEVKVNIDLDEPVEILSGRGASSILGKSWKCGYCIPLIFQDIPFGLLCFGDGPTGKLPVNIKNLISLYANNISHSLYTSNMSEYNDFEIEFSHALKAEILSEEVPQIIGFDASLHLLRCPEGGGDFHDFLQLPNGRMVIIVGKTSGWGVKASLNLAHLIPTIRGELSSGKPLSEVMEYINDDLIKHSNRSQLVSIAMMILDTRTRKARICRAGSVKMLRFKGGELSVFDEALGPHLGAFSGVKLTEVEMQFAPGDSLALMTDDINKFTEKKSLSLDKLSEKLATKMEISGGFSLADQVAMLLKESRAGSSQYDVTVLGIQRQQKKSVV